MNSRRAVRPAIHIQSGDDQPAPWREREREVEGRAAQVGEANNGNSGSVEFWIESVAATTDRRPPPPGDARVLFRADEEKRMAAWITRA